MGWSKEGGMIVQCEHCGHRGDIPAEAEGFEMHCPQCGEAFQALSDAERRARKNAARNIFAAVLILFGLLAVVLLNPGHSPALDSARGAVFGKPIASRVRGEGT